MVSYHLQKSVVFNVEENSSTRIWYYEPGSIENNLKDRLPDLVKVRTYFILCIKNVLQLKTMKRSKKVIVSENNKEKLKERYRNKKKKQGEMLFISTDEFEHSEFFCSEFSI